MCARKSCIEGIECNAWESSAQQLSRQCPEVRKSHAQSHFLLSISFYGCDVSACLVAYLSNITSWIFTMFGWDKLRKLDTSRMCTISFQVWNFRFMCLIATCDTRCTIPIRRGEGGDGRGSNGKRFKLWEIQLFSISSLKLTHNAARASMTSLNDTPERSIANLFL